MDTTLKLGKYELCELLATGSVAEVWKGYDPDLQRFVAIKWLHVEQAFDVNFLVSFRKEAQVVASLHHPNIVQIYEIVSPSLLNRETRPYMVMEYVEGETLAEHIQRTVRLGQFLPADALVHFFLSLGAAVDYAHRHGIIHRDIKPANILLGRKDAAKCAIGEPILTDFSLFQYGEGDTVAAGQSNVALGTPLYMSPEQIAGKPATHLSDVYALGLILYELCTGKHPFRAGDQPSGQHVIALLLRKVASSQSPPPPEYYNPSISLAVSKVIMRSIDNDPSRRYPTALALARDLTLAVSETSALPVSSSTALVAEHKTRMDERGTQPASAMMQQRTRPQAMGPKIRSFRQKAIGERSRWGMTAVVCILLILSIPGLLQLRIAALFPPHGQNKSAIVQVWGTVNFLTTMNANPLGGQGMLDGVHLSLRRFLALPDGKADYVWLLGDAYQSDGNFVLLGNLAYTGDTATLNYQDPQNRNLLAAFSQVLITQEDAAVVPTVPTPDKMKWLGMGSISQVPNPKDVERLSLLDHLRHLMASEPHLDLLGLHGGVNVWLFQNSGRVRDLATNAHSDLAKGNAADLRDDLVKLLDYLDGTTKVSRDLPAGTPNLVPDPLARVGLLEFDPAHDQPLGYLNHTSEHLRGMLSSPGVTTEQQSLASRINTAINHVTLLYEQMRTIAAHLFTLSNAQLLSQTSQIYQLEHLARAGYGTSEPSSQDSHQAGTAWIHAMMPHLAVFLFKYTAP